MATATARDTRPDPGSCSVSKEWTGTKRGVAVVAFGVSWLTKGEAIPADK